MIWHNTDPETIIAALESNRENGLTNGIADMRIEKYGKNLIKNIKRKSYRELFLKQLKNTMVIVLVIISLLSMAISLVYNQPHPFSALLIIAILLINAAISAYHLYTSERSLESLHGISLPATRVIRDGVERVIPSEFLVPGDILLLETGDFVTADARLIETAEFRCSELSFSGEPVPVEKDASLLFDDITPVAERKNMVFAGSSVIHGTAKAIVVATGLNTEQGHTASISQQSGEEELPLTKTLEHTGKLINIAIVCVCLLFFFIALIRNINQHPFAAVTVKLLLEATALAVAAIPEGLPAVSAIAIALGIERSIRDHILIKKTAAIELLGKTTVICADKTGILTHNRMTLDRIYDGEMLLSVTDEPIGEKNALLLRLAALCSTLQDDATEKAIEAACVKYNSISADDLKNAFPRLGVIPFDPELKTMSSINMINGKPYVIVKGAPELLLNKCVGCDIDDILKINDQMASDALRVVCIAMKPLNEVPANPHRDEIETNLTFIGLLGFDDPPRSASIEAVKLCREAGIRPIMITGDNLLTAKAVARRIGILLDGTEAITGAELAKLSDEELCYNIEKYTVFARITPADKVRIVNAWQKHGDTVTVTGDGIEDADALSVADIGCAMGKNGTDIARGSADTIITDNSFMSLVSAIKESRGLFDNIRKSVCYLFSCNIGEILTYLAGILFFKVSPLSAVQLLWINLLTDCAPAISLGMEKAEDGVMQRNRFSAGGRLLDFKIALKMALESIFISAMTLLSFSIGKHFGTVTGYTMAFATLGMIQIFHSYNLKTDRSLFCRIKELFNSNRFMAGSTLLTFFVIIFLVFTPAGFLFDMTILSFGQFMACFGLSFAVVPFCEIIKLIQRTMIKQN